MGTTASGERLSARPNAKPTGRGDHLMYPEYDRHARCNPAIFVNWLIGTDYHAGTRRSKGPVAGLPILPAERATFPLAPMAYQPVADSLRSRAVEAGCVQNPHGFCYHSRRLFGLVHNAG